ncbi:winged helix-turn-helix transcriptional regulator [Streptomyces sp. WG5]|uniref:winged helix-turn-helix transcriptional regulator n=1 Tax=Streptomyces sp. WG5 TaxID=3417648 RepID=UPI003CF00A0B
MDSLARAQNLRMLERNGLVERCVRPTVPPRVGYTLAEPSQGPRETTHHTGDWTHRYLGPDDASRRGFGYGP